VGTLFEPLEKVRGHVKVHQQDAWTRKIGARTPKSAPTSTSLYFRAARVTFFPKKVC